MEKELPVNPVDAAAGEKKRVEDEIIELLQLRTKDPGEAFVVLQQLSVFMWSVYNIDWKNNEGRKLADTREQRYLDFVNELISHRNTNNSESAKP